MAKKIDKEDKKEMKIKKGIIKHLKEDSKEFKKQIADDVKLKKKLKGLK